MSFSFTLITGVVCLFVGMLLAQAAGRAIGQRQLAKDPNGADSGNAEGAVFALLGLLIAFSFSGATSRFDERRRLIVDESNAIGTAWLRLDLLHAEDRERLRPLFRTYVDTRLAITRDVTDAAAVAHGLAETDRLQREIWSAAITACRADRTLNSTLVLNSFNDFIDISATRTQSMRTHPPTIIFVLLVVMALASSFITGHGTAKAATCNWLRTSTFALAVVLTFYVIMDIEYPRLGMIRIDASDSYLIDLRASMN